MPNVDITITGNLTADPELREAGGHSVAQFSVASTPRIKKGDEYVDGETVYLRVSVWRELADGAASTLKKGDAVVVTGYLRQRSFDKDGEKRTVFEVDGQSVGKSVRERRQGGGGNSSARVQANSGW